MSEPTSKTVPLSIPTVSASASRYLQECLDTGWVSTAGPFVKRFEDEVRQYTGSPFAVATASGTAALHLAYLTAGIGPASVVLVPTLSFIATANAVAYLGARCCFVDCEPATWNISRDTVRDALARARADGLSPTHVVATHLYGVPVEIEGLLELCDAEGLTLVEDAAESLGSWYAGRHTGRFGRNAALSFNGNKIITTGAGGMLLTGDEQIARHARHLSTQARTDARYYLHDEIGYNYRLSNLHAALGVSQLEDLPDLRKRRRAIQDVYLGTLGDLAWLTPQARPSTADVNGWLFSATVGPSAPLSRDEVLKHLDAAGIEARPVFEPIHRLPMYSKLGGACPQADEIARTGLSLPNSPTSDEHRVCAALHAIGLP